MISHKNVSQPICGNISVASYYDFPKGNFFFLAATPCFSSFSRAFCSLSICFFSFSIALLSSLTFLRIRSRSLLALTPSSCVKNSTELVMTMAQSIVHNLFTSVQPFHAYCDLELNFQGLGPWRIIFQVLDKII